MRPVDIEGGIGLIFFEPGIYKAIKLLCEEIVKGKAELGILVCGTGIGISLAANKIAGIRAAVCTNTFMARMSKEHNDANILALGERVLGSGVAIDIIDTWLNASFIGGRHKTRVDKISALEKI